MYVILSIFLFYLILKAFVKIKFHFWSAQPVFHIYDIHHWFASDRIVEAALPTIDKYVNLMDIKTRAIEEMSEEDVSDFCGFLKDNYLRSKGPDYLPEERHVMEYFKGANHDSFVSVFKTPKLAFNPDPTSKPEIEIRSVSYTHLTLPTKA